MSAYSNGRSSQVISLTNPASSSNSSGADEFPRLPQITQELETYFRLAGQLEASIAQERHEKRKFQQQLRESQIKLDQLTQEVELRTRETEHREETLKSQLSSTQEREKEKEKILKSIEIALAQEQDHKKKYQEQMRIFQSRYIQFCSETKNRFHTLSQNSDQLRSQLAQYKLAEKTHLEQIRNLSEQYRISSTQIENLKEEKRRLELDSELIKAKFQQPRQQEEIWKNTIAQMQDRNRMQQQQFEQLSRELLESKRELNEAHQKFNDLLRNSQGSRHEHQELKRKLSEALRDLESYKEETARSRSSWNQINDQYRQTTQETELLSNKIDDLTAALAQEKRRVEQLEDLVQKEKREKQIALSCLHTAEARLAQVTTALDESKKSQASQFCEKGLELNF